MAAKLQLTLACGDYEIVRALKMIKPDGIELKMLTDMDANTRHRKMIRNREFDVSELSLSSYLIAKSRGLALTAIPVFLHRRFRHGFIFVNTRKGIRAPADLIGRKVGLNSFQATAHVWMRGILEQEHGVPHKKLHWIIEGEETAELELPTELSWMRTPQGKSIDSMLAHGELDAVLHTDMIRPIVEKDSRVARLFENYKELEIDYYQRTGIFPIMHLTAIKQEIVDRYPWVPTSLVQALERAKQIAYERMANPRIVPLAWFQSAIEEQDAVLGKDPWAYGLGATNRRNLETLIRYALAQGLIARSFALSELFVNTG